MARMKTCILIPSYNEESTIGEVVKKLKFNDLEVIVIDDGSTDETSKIASEAGAIVMRHVKNLGKGISLKEGFDFVLRMTNFDSIIIMDGDGQHSPDDVPALIKHAEEKEGDIIVGNRMTYVKNMPFIRLATNRFMSFLLSLMCRQHIPDTQCGFRLIKRKVLEQLDLKTKKYDLDSEILIKASKKHFKIVSVPVKTIYKDELSSIHPVKDSFRFIALIFKSYFSK